MAGRAYHSPVAHSGGGYLYMLKMDRIKKFLMNYFILVNIQFRDRWFISVITLDTVTPIDERHVQLTLVDASRNRQLP